jgi:hypothetical protein
MEYDVGPPPRTFTAIRGYNTPSQLIGHNDGKLGARSRSAGLVRPQPQGRKHHPAPPTHPVASGNVRPVDDFVWARVISSRGRAAWS